MRGGFRFTLPSRLTRKKITGLPAFTTVKGAAYFFLPGIRALRWLANGGNFSGLTALEDEQWDAIRDTIKGTNEKDKAQRIGQ
jgi:hypothetical protein